MSKLSRSCRFNSLFRLSNHCNLFPAGFSSKYFDQVCWTKIYPDAFEHQLTIHLSHSLRCVASTHCNKKWAKRSFPLENNRSEEGKFPCRYWNIYPATHTVFIHSSVREKCSRLWTGNFTGLIRETSWNCLFSQIFPENSCIPCFWRTFPENSRIPTGRMF